MNYFSGIGTASHRSSIPILVEIAKLHHLGIVAPELIPQTVGQANKLYLELLIDARPFLTTMSGSETLS